MSQIQTDEFSTVQYAQTSFELYFVSRLVIANHSFKSVRKLYLCSKLLDISLKRPAAEPGKSPKEGILGRKYVRQMVLHM